MTIPVTRTGKHGQPRATRCRAAPQWSKHLYLRIPRNEIGFVKFLVESYDHLAYLSVVDKYGAVVRVVFAPGQEQELHQFIDGLGREISPEVITMNFDREGLQPFATPCPNETIR